MVSPWGRICFSDDNEAFETLHEDCEAESNETSPSSAFIIADQSPTRQLFPVTLPLLIQEN